MIVTTVSRSLIVRVIIDLGHANARKMIIYNVDNYYSLFMLKRYLVCGLNVSK